MCDQCNAPKHKEKSAEKRAAICAAAEYEARLQARRDAGNMTLGDILLLAMRENAEKAARA